MRRCVYALAYKSKRAYTILRRRKETMDARKRMALILTVLLFGMGGHAAFAEAQYTARDKNGQIVKQGTTTENEEFLAIDGLEYEFNGEHRIH